jgi:2-polyprenyl-6-methoxyphenol hydroxylase-like FAD-dependent oxidoreductase
MRRRYPTGVLDEQEGAGAVYDVIVVGARCAGASTAMLLARRGHRVLLVDRATFPSDTLSTHYVQQPAVARLRDWGLLDRLVATGCPPIPTYSLDFGGLALKGWPTPYDGVALAYGPRRIVLDELLVEAAGEAGAVVETGFSVDGLVEEDGQVTGIGGRTAAGAAVVERARLVVGADGLHSAVAKAVDAPVYDDRGTYQCGYYTYWSGVPADGFQAYVRAPLGVAANPTHDGLTCIPVVFPRSRFKQVRADIERHCLQAIDLTPLGEQVRQQGRREDRWYGTGDLPNRFRRPYGPGWALVGDAGYYQDPVTAHGITNAFRDAELLAEAVGRGLGGDAPMDVALAEYHRRRDDAARPMFELTCQFAAMEPPSADTLELLGALQGNQPATDRYFGMLAGSFEVDDFFASDHVAEVLAAARAPT